jgi:hypothetical protein
VYGVNVTWLSVNEVTGGVEFFVKTAATPTWPPLAVTVQTPIPAQAPLQPANVDPEAGVAVKATFVPAA